MKAAAVAALLVCALSAVSARSLNAAPMYATFSDALNAATTANLSTLVAAIGAANLTVPANATWTIFTPTDAAFASPDIQSKTGLGATQLLLPENQAALIAVLSYHVVPAAAVASTQLKDGQTLTTALASATPLIVSITDGTVLIKTTSQDTGAKVIAADIMAGSSIIHVIDKVLIPPSLVKSSP